MPIQIDMEMPKECEYCKFCTGSASYHDIQYYKCFLMTWIVLPLDMRKNPGCPLKEVK